MKILITGKTSYIANNIKTRLDPYYDVSIISLRDTDLSRIDISADVLIHCAAVVHRKDVDEKTYFSVNTFLTEDLAKAAKRSGVRQFIFLSTMSVYGLTVGEINENTLPSPIDSYGKSKLEAENRILKLVSEDFNVAIIRPPMVYGHNCPGNYKCLYRMLKRISVFPYVKNKRSMIYIDNLTELVRLIICSHSVGIFCPQNSQYVCTADMAKQIRLSLGKKIYLSRLLGMFFILLKDVTIVSKMFGNLTYDYKMSAHFDYGYCITGFNESISPKK